jgi:hypothetical protein
MNNQDIIDRYVCWKEHALAKKYRIPSRLNQNEKEQHVARVFWSFFWPVILDFRGNKTIDDMRVIIAEGLGEEEASNIDYVRKFWK